MQHMLAAQSSTSPTLARYCYLFFTLALFRSVGAQSVRIVGDSDPSVTYTPADLATNLCATAVSPDCQNKWFEENINGAYKGAVRSTQGPTASVQIAFQGSEIVVKGVTDNRSARAFVSLDGGVAQSIDTSSPDGQQHAGQVLYSMAGLNPTANHVLSIQYDASSVGNRRPHLLRIDSFEITGGPASSTDDGAQSDLTTATLSSVGSRPTNSNNNSTNTPPVVGTTTNSSSSSSTVPIVAGLATGLATLLLASAIFFWLLRRRRAVRIQSVELARPPTAAGSIRPPGRHTPANMTGLTNLAYAFNRAGSSTASSADAPQQYGSPSQLLPKSASPPPAMPPPRPQVSKFISPYTYQRRGPAYPRSESQSSIGLPVDERPPNPEPLSSQQTSPVTLSGPRILRVHNPGTSAVSSSNYH